MNTTVTARKHSRQTPTTQRIPPDLRDDMLYRSVQTGVRMC